MKLRRQKRFVVRPYRSSGYIEWRVYDLQEMRWLDEKTSSFLKGNCRKIARDQNRAHRKGWL